jgi:hypothetical protein
MHLKKIRRENFNSIFLDHDRGNLGFLVKKGNESLDSINYGKYLDQLKNY